MSRGLSEFEEDDASLSEATGGDILVDEIGDGEENSEVQEGTRDERAIASVNGHLEDGPVDTSDPLTSGTEDSSDSNKDSHRKDKGQHSSRFLANLSGMELNRYEAYCRSFLPRNKMKDLLSRLNRQYVYDEKILIVVCSLAKMFVAQIISESKSLSMSIGDDGPLHPHHIRKALKRLESKGGAFRRQYRRPFFRYSL